jgi:hypothetical protein
MNEIKVNDYVKDEAGTIWLVSALVSDAEGDHAVLLPAKAIIRFVVDIRDKRERRLAAGLETLHEITVTEMLDK